MINHRGSEGFPLSRNFYILYCSGGPGLTESYEGPKLRVFLFFLAPKLRVVSINTKEKVCEIRVSMMMNSDAAASREKMIATTALFSTSGSDEKANIFERLRSLIGETLDRIVREEESKGVSITQPDLVDWVNRLDKDGLSGWIERR